LASIKQSMRLTTARYYELQLRKVRGKVGMPGYNSSSATGAGADHPIQIPPEFPKILKQYTKAAIRTQPSDLLLWSASYFRCLSNGEAPPSKERLEYPPPSDADTGLTPGFLRVLHKQVGHLDVVNLTTLKSKWRGLCLPIQTLEDILKAAGCTTPYIKWKVFMIEGASMIISRQAAEQTKSGKTPDTEVSATMHLLIDVMADRTDGGVPTNLSDDEFILLLKMVCKRRQVDSSQIKEAEEYLRTIGQRQAGILTHENLKASDCPKFTSI